MTTATLTAPPALLCETTGAVARLTLNRPEKRNALSRELLADLVPFVRLRVASPVARVTLTWEERP